ncbi:hypothetical protein Pmani_026717 [Petrolisthes manimaculis]|uniref:Uncharacterized protein n=1 Tax=Petrolisthes manimaculis TaxID=1843537 RepID=A0AAE1P5J8_9EUCA|nr:hypothetical protein Pmani_026717 [Petrolisthes manimaculis]
MPLVRSPSHIVKPDAFSTIHIPHRQARCLSYNPHPTSSSQMPLVRSPSHIVKPDAFSTIPIPYRQAR